MRGLNFKVKVHEQVASSKLEKPILAKISLMRPEAAKKLPWESEPVFLASADERDQDVVFETRDTLSVEIRVLQRILEAHAFLKENGIEI